MLRFSLADALDILFYTACTWLLSFGVLRFLGIPLPFSVLVSVLFALAALTASSFLILRGRRKKLRGKREREARDALLLHLALEKEERVRAEILKALLADGQEAELCGDGLLSNGTILLPKFTMEPLSADMVASFLREYGEKPFCVLCNSLSEAAEKLLSSFGKKAMKGDEVYALFARTNAAPSPLICSKLPRRTAKTRIRSAFSRGNARPFFLSGALLLVMSLFVLFPVYYLVTGGVLVVTSVFVRLIGSREE